MNSLPPLPEKSLKNFSKFSNIYQKSYKKSLILYIFLAVCLYILYQFFTNFNAYKITSRSAYQYYITLISYQDFGFVKRAFYNSIFQLLGLNLSNFYQYLWVKILLNLSLFLLVFSWLFQKLNKINLKLDKNHLIFFILLLISSPGGLKHYLEGWIPTTLLMVIYLISVRLLAQKTSWINYIIVSFLSITGILHQQLWIFACLPFLLMISIDKKVNFYKLAVLVIPSIITLIILRIESVSGLQEKTLEEFNNKFLTLYPNFANQNFILEGWESVPWHASLSDNLGCMILLKRFLTFDGVFVLIILFLHILALYYLLKNIRFRLFWTILPLSTVPMYFIGADYGRWMAFSIFNSYLIVLYLLENIKFEFNISKYTIFILIFLLTFASDLGPGGGMGSFFLDNSLKKLTLVILIILGTRTLIKNRKKTNILQT